MSLILQLLLVISLSTLLISGTKAKYVIYGHPVPLGQYKWYAYLESKLDDGKAVHVCGGTLIRPRWVLTAAHCIKGTTSTTVRLGHVKVDSMPYKEEAMERIVHEHYGRFEHDIALLKMKKPAEGENIWDLMMSSSFEGTLTGLPLGTAGMGQTENGHLSKYLKKIYVRAISNEECLSMKPFDPRSITNEMVCTLLNGDSVSSVCHGDSGGPLVHWAGVFPTLVGVVKGSKDCNASYPLLSTKVSANRDWIEATIEKSLSIENGAQTALPKSIVFLFCFVGLLISLR